MKLHFLSIGLRRLRVQPAVQLVPDGGKRGGGVRVIGFKIQQPPQPALLVHDAQAVSYTHLDVYKRQHPDHGQAAGGKPCH